MLSKPGVWLKFRAHISCLLSSLCSGLASEAKQLPSHSRRLFGIHATSAQPRNPKPQNHSFDEKSKENEGGWGGVPGFNEILGEGRNTSGNIILSQTKTSQTAVVMRDVASFVILRSCQHSFNFVFLWRFAAPLKWAPIHAPCSAMRHAFPSGVVVAPCGTQSFRLFVDLMVICFFRGEQELRERTREAQGQARQRRRRGKANRCTRIEQVQRHARNMLNLPHSATLAGAGSSPAV